MTENIVETGTIESVAPVATDAKEIERLVKQMEEMAGTVTPPETTVFVQDETVH